MRIMRILLNTLILVLISVSSYTQTQFSKGFKLGYETGYCYGQGIGCMAPMAPMAPSPLMWESYDSYTDGYNRGFTVGTQARVSGGSGSNYSTSKESLNVYGNPSYTPKVTEFKPDWDFYWKALDRANQVQQQQQYLQYQQQVYQQYLAEQAYQQRVNYINSVLAQYKNKKEKPKTVADGYHVVFVTALNDYRDQIKVYVENNKIVRYYWDNYYEATVISSTNISKGKATIRIDAMGVKTGDMDVYFMKYLEDPDYKVSGPLKPAFVVLYATKKKTHKYGVSIGNTNLGHTSKVFKDGLPSYGQEGAISFYLKPGDYSIALRKGNSRSFHMTWLRVTVKENQVVAYKID